MRFRLRLRPLLALAAILLIFPPAAAQYGPEDDDDIRQSVARVSYFEGEVSFNRGDAPDDWQPASVNYPMTLGDRIWAGRNARAELQLRGATVYLGPETELAALDLSLDARQLSLTLGTATFRINRLERDDFFEVATPNVSVTFETPGSYRIDVDEDGNSRVSVLQGRASAAAAGGQVALERGDQIRVRGIDRPDYDVLGLARTDAWDRWVENRARRYRSVRSASYVHPDIYGAADLDAYGSWESGSEYGSVWYPRGMASGWEPYRSGRWIWRDPWGWTWLSSEPWGWAPYHYGRWAVVRGRWGWVPVGPGARFPGYSPAVVGFVGGGSGWSVSISAGGFVGWFPLGPREPFDPWWRRSRSTADVTGFSYAYRNRMTVVARDVFVRGGRVDRDVVRDTRIMREVATAPILRGPIPVLPTRESIRVTPLGVQTRVEARPPNRIGGREVVTRTAPPPAPPSFDRKLVVIRDSGGGAVQADVGRRLSADEHRGEKAAQPVRPAAREGVLLAPRGDVKVSRRPQPLPPTAERPRVTGDRPAPARVDAAPASAPDPRREVETSRPTAAPRRVDAPDAPPVRERAPAPQPELRRETTPVRPVPEAKPVRREVETTRPTIAPRRVDAPDAPPVRERAPAPPQPELKREPTPERPAPEAKPARREPLGPPARNLDRPDAAPTPRLGRLPSPEPTVGKTETKPDSARPDKVEPKRSGPDRVGRKPAPTPTPN
jgi:hypothetical protein